MTIRTHRILAPAWGSLEGARSAGRLARSVAVCAALSAALATSLLSGCATPPQPGASAQSRADVEYQGRFSVRYVDQNGQQRDAYGNFDWVERADTVTLELRNPLGSTLAVVEASPTSATLRLPNQPPRSASNVEDLMQRALGFPMPVSGMRYWLRNQVAPTSQAQTTLDKAGHPQQIVQDGWQIDYLDLTTASAGGTVLTTSAASSAAVSVHRMNLVRQDGNTDTPLQVKLVINP